MCYSIPLSHFSLDFYITLSDCMSLSIAFSHSMKAVYLRSVVSPIKLNVDLNHRPTLKYINDFEESEVGENQRGETSENNI